MKSEEILMNVKLLGEWARRIERDICQLRCMENESMFDEILIQYGYHLDKAKECINNIESLK